MILWCTCVDQSNFHPSLKPLQLEFRKSGGSVFTEKRYDPGFTELSSSETAFKSAEIPRLAI